MGLGWGWDVNVHSHGQTKDGLRGWGGVGVGLRWAWGGVGLGWGGAGMLTFTHTLKYSRAPVDQDPDTDYVGGCTVDMHVHKNHFIRKFTNKMPPNSYGPKTPRQTFWEPAQSTCACTRATLYGNLQAKLPPNSYMDPKPRDRRSGSLQSRHARAQEPLYREIYMQNAAEQLYGPKTPRQTFWEPAQSTCTCTRATLYRNLQVKFQMTKKSGSDEIKSGTSERLTG